MKTILGALGAATLLLGCESSSADAAVDAQAETSQNQALHDAHALWAANRPSHYVMSVCSYGFVHGCVRTAVDGETVTKADSKSEEADEAWLAFGDSASAPEPVAGMFDSAEHACVSKLVFDEQLGFVRDVYIACRSDAGRSEGESAGRRVSCFAADTLDTRACP